MIQRSAATLLLVTLTACAGEQAAREVAQRTSGFVNDFKRELAEFSQRQTQLNGQIARDVQLMGQAQATVEAETQRRVAAWAVADDKASVELYRQLSAVTASNVTTDAAALATAQSRSTAPGIAICEFR